MATDKSLTGSEGVRKFQTMLHAKAKEDPKRRFHALCDKVWREDFLREAWEQVRRNGGSAGVDGEGFKDIEAYGVGRWLGELARDLREGTYVPKPVRQVLIPKKQPGKFRPLGIPCIRDRVAQAAALLVLEPIIEADLQPEQYGYRPGRSANDAVKRVHELLQRGYQEVVDGDLSNYFGEIPHAELMKSIARRVSDGRMLRLIKAWLEMPVEEDDGKGGRRRTNRGRRERKGTPQGAPISPLLSNLYMRRFVLGWKVLGYARRFRAEIVNYADDFRVLGKAPAAEMLTAVKRIMEELKLPVNERKTRCLRCPEEPMGVSGISHRTQLSPQGERSLYRHSTQPGERPEHLPQDQRVDGAEERDAASRTDGRTPEPGYDRVGELLCSGAGEPGLPSDRPPRGRAAASVALSEAQGEDRGDGALLGRETMENPWTHLPGVEATEPSVGEGMILTESRMRENRTSGLTSGGEETQRGTRLRHRRVAKAAGNSDSLDLRPARLPSTLPKNDEGPLRDWRKLKRDPLQNDGKPAPHFLHPCHAHIPR